RVVMQRTATPCTPVRFRPAPPFLPFLFSCLRFRKITGVFPTNDFLIFSVPLSDFSVDFDCSGGPYQAVVFSRLWRFMPTFIVFALREKLVGKPFFRRYRS